MSAREREIRERAAGPGGADLRYLLAALDEARRERDEALSRPRPGQALFNAWLALDPAFAEFIRGGDLDPFHVQSRFAAALSAWKDAAVAAQKERAVKVCEDAARKCLSVEGKAWLEGCAAAIRRGGE